MVSVDLLLQETLLVCRSPEMLCQSFGLLGKSYTRDSELGIIQLRDIWGMEDVPRGGQRKEEDRQLKGEIFGLDLPTVMQGWE